LALRASFLRPGDAALGRLAVGVVDEESEEVVPDDRLPVGVGVGDVALAVDVSREYGASSSASHL
jgi:hypothetical protein